MNTKQNIAVIGSNYGDEGKGRVVDNIVKYAENPIVIRFSGSNNAAHTVCLDENMSNVFNLLGSGSFRNAPTYLYKHVSVDVVALFSEVNKFKEKFNFTSKVYIDPRCNVILPYDVVLNRAKEILRGASLHGSTGNGLNESIVRNEMFPIKIGMLEDSFNMFRLSHARFVKEIEQYHSSLDGQLKEFVDFLLDSSNIAVIYNKILNCSRSNDFLIEIPELYKYSCIFEGSQGLLLDEYSDNFPHVTRSRTGSHNLVDIEREFNISIDEITYVTLVYLSRHGEDKSFINTKGVHSFYNIIDNTNVRNDWQGSMKYNFLNLDELSNRIKADFDAFKIHSKNVEHKIAVTCIDQCINNTGAIIINGELTILENFKQSIVRNLHFKGHAASTFESPIN